VALHEWFTPREPAVALDALARLSRDTRRCLQPWTPKASISAAEALFKTPSDRQRALKAAHLRWSGDFGSMAEAQERDWQLVAAGWSPFEDPDRFLDHAEAIYGPLLAAWPKESA
jgi:exonuclease V gamma subunit